MVKRLLKKFHGQWRSASRYNPNVVAQWVDLLQREFVLSRMANALMLSVLIVAGKCRVVLAGLLTPGGIRGLISRKSKQPKSTALRDCCGEVARLSNSRLVVILAELSIPQCTKYRIEHKVQMFQAIGFKAVVFSWQDARGALNALQTARLLLAYRVPAVSGVLDVYREARRLGIKIVFDIDDLVFDVESYSTNSNLKDLPEKDRKNLLHGAQLYGDALRSADYGMASTPTLAKAMQRYVSGQVFLLENGLDNQLLKIANEPLFKPKDGHVRIVYASGTTTHDADFRCAAAAVKSVLLNHSTSLFVVMGHLTLPPDYEACSGRIGRMPFVGADDFYRLLRMQDINLAPLEPGVFNDAKSCIKFIEASVLGLPTVASPAAEFARVIRHGENGFLANDDKGWEQALASLIADENLRAEIGSRARETVLELFRLEFLANHRLLAMMNSLYSNGQGAVLAKKRSILLVNIFFAPVSFGGATVVVNNLALAMAANPDCHVTVFTGSWDESSNPGEVRRYAWSGIDVFAVRIGETGRESDVNVSEVNLVFRDILEHVRPDVVHFHSIQHLGARLCVECSRMEIPYFITLHDAWWLCERQFMVNSRGFCGQKAIDPSVCSGCVADPAYMMRRRSVMLDGLAGAHGIFTPGEYHRALHVNSGIPSDRVRVNKNGVLLPTSTDVKLDRKNRNGPLVLAYVGGRATHKGYFWLKSIMETLHAADYVLRLVDVQAMLGSSPMIHDAWNISGKVEVVPPYQEQNLDEFYAGIDVLLFPSQWKESFGLTVREAMVRDVWVISTDCGGPVEDLEPGVNGDLVGFGDADGFRKAILSCLENPARIRAYRNPVKNKIRGYHQQADELLGYYHDLTHCLRAPLNNDIKAGAG